MILPDLLGPCLDVVFCGTAPGRASAMRRAYYAGPGNAFWPVLHRVGLTPALVSPAAYRTVLCLGIGLTDLNKTEFGQDAALSPDGWDVAGFLERIDQVRPRRVAFTSKTAGAVCFGVPTSALRCGVQERDVAGIETWVLPSPSGQARSHWSEEPWMDLGRAVAMSRLGNDRRDALEDAGGG